MEEAPKETKRACNHADSARNPSGHRSSEAVNEYIALVEAARDGGGSVGSVTLAVVVYE